jgi:beta-glucosidase
MGNFIFGAASSAYQIEGGVKEDGKGPSIWDDFSHIEGKTANGDNGDLACDSYHKAEEDVALLKELGVKAYRFSVSWTRILPEGIGAVNQKGLQYYQKLISLLKEAGIEPIVTLFHWDLPAVLQQQGGFLSEKMPMWFREYSKAVVQGLGKDVKYWITINEPQCIIGNGYRDGTHAPGLKLSNKECCLAVYHLLKAHGEAVKVIRELCPGSLISFASTGTFTVPYEPDNKILDKEAERRSFLIPDDNPFFSISLYEDPIFLGDYPKDAYKKFGKDLVPLTDEDKKLIGQKLDFVSHNIYTGKLLYLSYGEPSYEKPIYAIEPSKADIWWEPVIPSAMYFGPKYLYKRYKLPIMISENGMCENTSLSDDHKVHDRHRCIYIDEYFSELKRAMKEGVKVIGYLYWSLEDNFEWAEGYAKRFGLVYLPFPKTERIKKDSFFFYQKLIKDNKDL